MTLTCAVPNLDYMKKRHSGRSTIFFPNNSVDQTIVTINPLASSSPSLSLTPTVSVSTSTSTSPSPSSTSLPSDNNTPNTATRSPSAPGLSTLAPPLSTFSPHLLPLVPGLPSSVQAALAKAAQISPRPPQGGASKQSLAFASLSVPSSSASTPSAPTTSPSASVPSADSLTSPEVRRKSHTISAAMEIAQEARPPIMLSPLSPGSSSPAGSFPPAISPAMGRRKTQGAAEIPKNIRFAPTTVSTSNSKKSKGKEVSVAQQGGGTSREETSGSTPLGTTSDSGRRAIPLVAGGTFPAFAFGVGGGTVTNSSQSPNLSQTGLNKFSWTMETPTSASQQMFAHLSSNDRKRNFTGQCIEFLLRALDIEGRKDICFSNCSFSYFQSR
jgi:hypothetical protein